MKRPRLTQILPSWKNAALAVLAAVMLVLAFPDLEWWWMAWIALVPLMLAVEREKASTARSFITGWIFGTAFFFGTCWWLTFAPITYAGFPPWLAYSGMVFVALVVGVFPATFAGIMALLLRRFGYFSFLMAPFVWVFTEFLRYWLTGNNWNAIGYAQAFGFGMGAASIGGVYLVGFWVTFINSFVAYSCLLKQRKTRIRLNDRFTLYGFITAATPLLGGIMLLADRNFRRFVRRPRVWRRVRFQIVAFPAFMILLWCLQASADSRSVQNNGVIRPNNTAYVVAVQPNVPMAGLDYSSWGVLRERQIQLAEQASQPDFTDAVNQQLQYTDKLKIDEDRKFYEDFYREQYSKRPKLLILPESPMNFMYNDDREFQQFINDFARRNNVSVLFNSAEPDATNGKYFNAAVMVGPQGSEVAEYDKIFLLPFGEAVPPFLEGILPGFVGNFSYGRKYDLMPVGDAKAGVMICFESHFGALSRRYVRDGADVIIEMTNDGYLGPTPVLRQHLANAVFRAVETNRPVLRVTNVGVTAYINERGQVLDPAPTYAEATRTWSVSRSDGSQTFYVRFGDWFAWLCTAVTLGLSFMSLRRKVAKARA